MHEGVAHAITCAPCSGTRGNEYLMHAARNHQLDDRLRNCVALYTLYYLLKNPCNARNRHFGRAPQTTKSPNNHIAKGRAELHATLMATMLLQVMVFHTLDSMRNKHDGAEHAITCAPCFGARRKEFLKHAPSVQLTLTKQPSCGCFHNYTSERKCLALNPYT